MQHRIHRAGRGRSARVLIAVLLALGLTAAACGGDDDDGGESAETTAAGGGAATTEAGGGETSAGATTAAAPPEAEPTPGGRLVMGIEADTGNPWTPANMLCAVSCYQVTRSVYDSLTLANAEYEMEPYLAESVTPNADYTEWTIKVRSGVTFHDGTPLDGAAVVDNLERHRRSFLTGKILVDVTNVAVSPADPMTVVVTIARPWVDLPIYMAGQIGMIASPTWLAAVDADPTKATQPVGTGPFVFADYKPGESFTARKNPNYWNPPYPYLDEVEFRVVIDGLTRQSALEAGDVMIIHTSNGRSIVDFRENAEEFPMTEVTISAETAYDLINVGDPASPLADKRVRCGLANSQDIPAVIDRIQEGVNEPANSPFSDGQLGHLDDTGYPTEQNMGEAQRLIAEYKAENPGPITLALSTTPDETNQVVAQAQAEWFREAGIDDVQISTVEQGQYIGLALVGDFDVFQWRSHGVRALDAQYIWWHSSTALPFGELALNFGRIKDPVIDDALDANRGETDQAKKQEYAETIARQFASECYNLWRWYTQWGIPHVPDVQGIDQWNLPSGSPALLGSGLAGSFLTHGVWLEQ